jgi:hypothetical protein
VIEDIEDLHALDFGASRHRKHPSQLDRFESAPILISQTSTFISVYGSVEKNARDFRRGHVKARVLGNSEAEFRPELNCPWIADGEHSSEGRGSDRNLAGARQVSKVRMIENIESFSTQLQPYSTFAGQIEVLKQREVEPLGWWTLDDSATAIAHYVGDWGRGGRLLKAGDIQPLLKRMWPAAVRITEYFRADDACDLAAGIRLGLVKYAKLKVCADEDRMRFA